MKILLVRHGETNWNNSGKFQGQVDISLNNTGIAQAKATARLALAWDLTAIYSSPLSRTLEVSSYISQLTGIKIRTDPRLMELNLGLLEGITGQDMRDDWSDLWNNWREDPGSVTMPKGESLFDLQERAWAAFMDIHNNHCSTDTVAIVSHNFTIRCICTKLLEIPMSNYHCLSLDLGSVTALENTGITWKLLTYNSVSHLSQLNHKLL